MGCSMCHKNYRIKNQNSVMNYMLFYVLNLTVFCKHITNVYIPQ